MEAIKERKSRVRSRISRHTPKEYNVVMHNDDITPIDGVVIILTIVLQIDAKKAISLALAAHENGKAVVVGPFSKDMANTYLDMFEVSKGQLGLSTLNFSIEEN